MSAIVQAQPKPRLGDYYTGLGHVEWEHATRSRKVHNDQAYSLACDVFHPTKGLIGFGGDNAARAWLQVFVDASDAFAFGALKYGIGCWRDVPSDEHMQGAGRHFKAWLDDPESLDLESGLSHRKHFLARAIMCLEQRRTGK